MKFKSLYRKVFRGKLVQVFRHSFHISPPSINCPIFIIGTVRSGKSTLAKCLGEHPGIMYVRYELTREWCELAEIEIARTHNNGTVCPPYTELDATETRCNKVRYGFAEIFWRNGGQGDTHFLDENPHLWNKLPFVRKIFQMRLLLLQVEIFETRWPA